MNTESNSLYPLGRQFSLNHDSTGTRYSGSYSGDGYQDWSDRLSREFALLAKPGDVEYLGPSVYVACIERT